MLPSSPPPLPSPIAVSTTAHDERSYNPLSEAIKLNNESEALRLINSCKGIPHRPPRGFMSGLVGKEHYVQIIKEDEEGKFPIHYAAIYLPETSARTIIQELDITFGSFYDPVDAHNKTAAHYAIEHNKPRLTMWLAKRMRSIWHRDVDNNSLIDLARKRGDAVLVAKLQEIFDESGAIHLTNLFPYSFESKHGKIIPAFINTFYGFDWRLKVYLLNNPNQADYVDNEWGRNFLHYATMSYQTNTQEAVVVEMIEFLLSHQININHQDKLRRTPAHYAALGKYNSVLAILEKHGARMDIVDEDNKTPIDLLMEHDPIPNIDTFHRLATQGRLQSN